jgi:Ca-activated chloride channel family protein
VKAGGMTALLDAVFAGLSLREADQGRTLLLVFSDGRDTASWLTAAKVLDATRRTDVVIYPVTLRAAVPQPVVVPQEGMQQGRIRVLTDRPASLFDALADDSGGRVFYADNEGALSKTFVEVLSEFRQRYVLTYTPTDVANDGWHTIEVKLRGRRGEVKARRGYFASPVKRGAAARARS